MIYKNIIPYLPSNELLSTDFSEWFPQLECFLFLVIYSVWTTIFITNSSRHSCFLSQASATVDVAGKFCVYAMTYCFIDNSSLTLSGRTFHFLQAKFSSPAISKKPNIIGVAINELYPKFLSKSLEVQVFFNWILLSIHGNDVIPYNLPADI